MISVFLGLKIVPAHRQYRSVTQIESVGGAIIYRENENFPDWGPSSGFVRDWLGPRILDTPTKIRIEATTCSQDVFQAIARLPDVTFISLHGSNVEDEAIKAISRLPKLKYLNLRDSAITDDAMQSLKTSSSLDLLDVTGTRVSKSAAEAFVQDFSVVVSHATKFEAVFFDEAGQEVSFPLLVGQPYLVGIRLQVPSGCRPVQPGYAHMSYTKPDGTDVWVQLQFVHASHELFASVNYSKHSSVPGQNEYAVTRDQKLVVQQPCTAKLVVNRSAVSWSTTWLTPGVSIDVPFVKKKQDQ